MALSSLSINVSVDHRSFKYYPVQLGAGGPWAISFEYIVTIDGKESEAMRSMIMDDEEKDKVLCYATKRECVDALKEITQ